MDQPNQDSNSGVPAVGSVKRRRGRPRLDPSQKAQRMQNVVRNVRVPPGFAGVNGNQPREVEEIEHARDDMLGQAVSGVIEAAFDAGYLLTVRVGNSDITLRGVIFKPGRYVPLSSENDVAPNVQMVRRNEIPLPRQNHSQAHGNRHRNGNSHPSNESQPANQLIRVAPRAAMIASKGKQVPAVPIQAVSPLSARGKMVPVTLHPFNLSNGIPPAAPAPHLVSSKGKQVPPLALQAPPLSNGPTPFNQVPHQNQNNHQASSTGVQNEGDPLHNSMSEVSHDTEAKSRSSPNVPFQTLLGEVIKRKSRSQSADTHSENIEACGTMSARESGFHVETGVPNMNEPLFVKPLQAVQPNPHGQSASAPKPMGSDRTGKMTELLQVVQESMIENQLTQAWQPNTDHKLRSPESELEDEDSVHSNKRSRTSSD